MLISNLEWSKS